MKINHSEITSCLVKLVLVGCLVIGCARQAPPPGGPIDKTPPRVLGTIPRSDSTGVGKDTKVIIFFSEPVDRKSAQESIFITPLPSLGVRYKWHGKKLEILFSQGLLPERTYVITIGAGTKDRRNNPMLSSFSFAFSTGDSLDRGELSGRVYSDLKVEGTQVWAYDLNANPVPNPAKEPPLYITQTGAKGDFHLAYMAYGRYRLFAVTDRNLNSRYDAEREAIAVAAKDFELSSTQAKISDIFLRLAQRDTTPPRLAEVIASDRNHLLLRFSEKMASTALSGKNNYEIQSDSTGLTIEDCFVDRRNSAIVHCRTSTQSQGVHYTVRVKSGFDLALNPLAEEGSQATFVGSALADSTKPYVVDSIPKNRASFFAVDSAIVLFFSETMDTLSVMKSVKCMDSGKVAIGGRFTWPNSAQMVFTPEKLLVPKMNYALTGAVDSIFDQSGNRLADTSLVIRFRTINPDTLSEISGTIKDADSLASGRIFLTARSASGASYQIDLKQPGPYRFERLMPSIYTIEVFRDEDENGIYSLGRPFPFLPAERFYVYPDTIRVRSRWPNEGNDILLPK